LFRVTQDAGLEIRLKQKYTPGGTSGCQLRTDVLYFNGTLVLKIRGSKRIFDFWIILKAGVLCVEDIR
jgi:hypothetical protein